MIGVVADDITGANDIGIMFAKSGFIVDVYSSLNTHAIREMNRRPDVLILDTDSRFDDVETAYKKVFEATRVLQSLGITQYYNKTCSVFRGNIGAEFDAMLDALEEEFAVIVLGFPKNGRTTKNSTHYVHGKALEHSEFRQDPMHPMTQSNLVDILQAQTTRKVTSITYDHIQKGPLELSQYVNELRAEAAYAYVVLDVTEQADLKIIAQAVGHHRILCGSSALAEELARWGKSTLSSSMEISLPAHSAQGILVAAGSLMPQTAAQIEYMRRKGLVVVALNTLDIFDKDTRERAIAEHTRTISEEIDRGSSVIVHSTNDDTDLVQQTKAKGMDDGLSEREVSRLVSATVAEITYRVLLQTGQQRFIIAGGDTSAAVCHRLGIKGMTVWKEIQPGLPSCVSISNNPMLFVLKSGSFGTADFFEKALAHLKLY